MPDAHAAPIEFSVFLHYPLAMDDREHQFFLGKLNETRDVFLNQVRGVSEERARWKPGPDRWSILDCAEHVALVEQRMFDLLTQRMAPCASAEPIAGTGREYAILTKGADRSEKLKAPEPAQPNGRFATLGEAVAAFEERRARSIAYVGGCKTDLRALEGLHGGLGRVTAQEVLSLLTIHPARHALQIGEIRADPSFPK